mmetsp:Transcript_10208/g.20594  ORF Transcript_10208/g.20594 Transcript_10208/m.20594 type:complete len:250 (-) Transcript_10208:121-870(-)
MNDWICRFNDTTGFSMVGAHFAPLEARRIGTAVAVMVETKSIMTCLPCSLKPAALISPRNFESGLSGDFDEFVPRFNRLSNVFSASFTATDTRVWATCSPGGVCNARSQRVEKDSEDQPELSALGRPVLHSRTAPWAIPAEMERKTARHSGDARILMRRRTERGTPSDSSMSREGVVVNRAGGSVGPIASEERAATRPRAREVLPSLGYTNLFKSREAAEKTSPRTSTASSERDIVRSERYSKLLSLFL